MMGSGVPSRPARQPPATPERLRMAFMLTSMKRLAASSGSFLPSVHIHPRVSSEEAAPVSRGFIILLFALILDQTDLGSL